MVSSRLLASSFGGGARRLKHPAASCSAASSVASTSWSAGPTAAPSFHELASPSSSASPARVRRRRFHSNSQHTPTAQAALIRDSQRRWFNLAAAEELIAAGAGPVGEKGGPYKITDELWKQLRHYATFPQTGVSLRQMVMFGQNPSQGTLLRASQFLAEELPIRLARRVKELDELPHNLNKMPSIEKVKNWYAKSFEELINFPKPDLPPEIAAALQRASADSPQVPESKPNPSLPSHMKSSSATKSVKDKNLAKHRYFIDPGQDVEWPPEVHDYNERFTKVLSNIKRRHDPVVTTIAQGILEFKKETDSKSIDRSIQTFLDRFYMSRIGIRVLIGQHIALNRLEAHDDYVGIICTETNIHQIAREAIENATYVCEEHYGLFKGPPVQLVCPKDLTFSYIPSHLNHMLFEILKNSLRATVEKHGVDCEDYPPVKVIVAEGSEDITIKISDEGGGIPRSAVPLVWTFMYTTAAPENLDQDFQGTDFKAPMAGFGYGLPIARLYSQYFGGNLKLISMEGYGTDVYLHLSRLSSSSEPLQ